MGFSRDDGAIMIYISYLLRYPGPFGLSHIYNPKLRSRITAFVREREHGGAWRSKGEREGTGWE